MAMTIEAKTTAISKISFSHEKMIDAIVANPRVSGGQLAAMFGYTPGWVSRVMSSDSFKVQVAKRRVEIVDPIVMASVEERFKALAQRGLEVMQEKLDQPAELVTFNDAAKATEIGARGLAIGGYGAKVQVDIHNQIDLRAAIEEGHARRREIVINQPPEGRGLVGAG